MLQPNESSEEDRALEALALEVEDLDDNKDLDMVVANRDTNNLSILMGLGNGTFNPPINLGVGAAPSDLATGANLAVSDFALPHTVRLRIRHLFPFWQGLCLNARME